MKKFFLFFTFTQYFLTLSVCSSIVLSVCLSFSNFTLSFSYFLSLFSYIVFFLVFFLSLSFLTLSSLFSGGYATLRCIVRLSVSPLVRAHKSKIGETSVLDAPHHLFFHLHIVIFFRSFIVFFYCFFLFLSFLCYLL